MKTDRDGKIFKANLPLNWMGLYNVFAVDLCSFVDTPDGSAIGADLS